MSKVGDLKKSFDETEMVEQKPLKISDGITLMWFLSSTVIYSFLFVGTDMLKSLVLRCFQ